MGYKSLLTIAGTDRDLSSTIPAAAAIALDQNAHLEALALGTDHSQLGYSYSGAGPVLLQIEAERAKLRMKAVEAAQTAALTAEPRELRWSSEAAVTQFGAIGQLVGARARYADLVILAQPYGENAGDEAEAITEAALFEGMAPVLIMPAKSRFAPFPGTIILGWDQSREAMVAARRAMPFLKRAAKVVITVIDPPVRGAERSDPGGALCQFLVRHGVRAEVAVLARTLPGIADVLARQAADHGADMLVMGAYGHSRFREAILGGATRDMLSQSKIPLFLAH